MERGLEIWTETAIVALTRIVWKPKVSSPNLFFEKRITVKYVFIMLWSFFGNSDMCQSKI